MIKYNWIYMQGGHANLKLTKDKDTGYIFNPDNCWKTLYLDTDVCSVSIISDLKSLRPMDVYTLYAKVEGINNPNQKVVWSVDGNESSKTVISENGELTVGNDETAKTIVVRATSFDDPEKYGEFAISITKSDEPTETTYEIPTIEPTQPATGAAYTEQTTTKPIVVEPTTEAVEPTTSSNPIVVEPTETTYEVPTTEAVELTGDPMIESTTSVFEPTIQPIVEPSVTQDDNTNTQKQTIKPKAKKSKKKNTITVKVKTKTIKLKKLKKKAQTVKPLTVKKAKGKVTYKLIKKGTAKKIWKYLKISKKGAITVKKWKKAKKGTYIIKVRITAKGNKSYKSKSVTKTVKIKIKK